MKTNFMSVGLLAAAMLVQLSAQAKVVLPHYLTSNMVVQRNSVLTVKGHATPKHKVTAVASWNQKAKVTVKSGADGSFSLQLSTPEAGGPYTITLNDGSKLVLDNVMSGEVWFCSGQSNMEMPLAGWGKVLNYEEEIKNANYPNIRIIQIKHVTSHVPAADVETDSNGWQACSPATIPGFSSLAYFYARELQKNINVPIGLINSSWGGTLCEAWVSSKTLESVSGVSEMANKMAAVKYDDKALQKMYNDENDAWYKEFNKRDAGYENGKPCWTNSLQSGEGWKSMQLPCYWETNGMPAYNGTVWFQKEITVPESWTGKSIEIHLSKIDDDDVTYFNGVQIGSTVGVSNWRVYTIPASMVKGGKSLITVKVVDTGGEGGIYGKAEDMYAQVGNDRVSLAGTWTCHVGATMDALPDRPMEPTSPNYPSVLYNAMVAPFTSFPIRGVLWYQGEANTNRTNPYSNLFQGLINDWRKQWNNDMPFYFVQLSAYGAPQIYQDKSGWANVRESQESALGLYNTGMVTSTDLGTPTDIHPKNKQEFGRRMAQLALAKTYGIGCYSLAKPENYVAKDGEIKITFTEPVEVKSGKLTGFAMSGTDGVFHDAEAIVADGGKAVIVKCAAVAQPFAVRYNWADCPVGNLFAKSGMPVGPFRTDKW